MEVGSVATDHLATPQRRYLSILFCDLVGYTALSEKLDPEDLLELQRRYQKLALTVMERYSGFVARFSGDGILVYFGYPTAHENDAERAVRAALELTEQMSKADARAGLRRASAACGARWHSYRSCRYRLGNGERRPSGPQHRRRAGKSCGASTGGCTAEFGRRQRRDLELVEGLFEFEHSRAPNDFKGITRIIPVFKVNRARVSAHVAIKAERVAPRSR